MAERCTLKLTEEEEKLTERDNPYVLDYLLRAAGEKGHYVSKTGWVCYPVLYYNNKSFVCIRDDKCGYETIDFFEDKLFDFVLKIDNGLLPKIDDIGEVRANFIEVTRNREIVILKLNGKTYVQERYYSSMGGGSSDGTYEAITKIFKGDCVDVSNMKYEDILKINEIKFGKLLDCEGYILGTKKILLQTRYGNDHVIIRSPSKVWDTRERLGLYKKNPLYPRLLECPQTIICHKIFETKSGFPIYDIDEVIV